MVQWDYDTKRSVLLMQSIFNESLCFPVREQLIDVGQRTGLVHVVFAC